MKNIMVLRVLIVSLLLAISLNINLIAQVNEDIIRAMKDEIARSMKGLKMESLENPYFIEYTLKISKPSGIKSILGNIINSTTDESARLTVGMRIGDYKFDNTNFSGGGMIFFGGGSSDDVERYSNRLVSYELDYNTLRKELWLATDAAYMKSAENFSKKTAVVKSRMRKDTTWDFTKTKPRIFRDILKIEEYDNLKYETLCKDLSAIFRTYPELNTSNVSFEYLPEITYYVNSEGTEYIRTETTIGLEISGSTQAKDGMILTDFYSCYANRLSELPNKDSLIKATKYVAETITALKEAPLLDDTYAGPVVFTEQASSELFAQIFLPNLVTRRDIITSMGFPTGERFKSFQKKIGGRVLPEFLSIKAEPQKEKFANTPLIGFMKVDDEGEEPQNIILVKKGYLKTLFASRVPTKRIRKTNGHKISGSSGISNIFFINSNKKKQLSYTDLKTKMMKLCKDRELPYGIVVKRIMNNNIQQTSIIEQIFMGDFSYMSGGDKINLCEVYKVFPDGREELVRGAQGAGITVQSFKDIIYTGNKANVYNFWNSTSGYGNWYGSTIVMPDILFEDCEIQSIDKDFKKPPLLPNPILEK